MRLAIVKPDHLGDLVLSSGAIRTLLGRYPASTLFVSPKTMGLARHLFPDAVIRQVEFPHLVKTGGDPPLPLPAFDRFDQMVMLRNDQVVDANWLERHAAWYVQPADTHLHHQSLIDYTAVRCLVPAYDLDAAFHGARMATILAKATRRPRAVGLSIGSGFHANGWPLLRWVELARLLVCRHDEVRVLCGPGEAAAARLIARGAGSPASLSVHVGGGDIAGFLSGVDDLDLVVASDGGTAHLCSLRAPILSLFGPSPFRRYAPFGRLNRLVRRDLSCSPCCQYATHLVNGCLTVECMGGLSAALVAWLVANPPRRDASAGMRVLEGDIQLVTGTSHLDRDGTIAAFEELAGAA